MAVKIDNSYPWYDVVTGSAAELVAAGIVTADMLPGQPGMGKVMCTFVGGQRVRQGSYVRGNDPSYRQISRTRKDFYKVLVGIADAEIDRRLAQEEANEKQATTAAAACLIDAGAPAHWVGRVGIHFAARVMRGQHMRLVNL